MTQAAKGKYLLALLLSAGCAAMAAESGPDKELLDLSFDELLEVRVASSATLAPTSTLVAPSRITRIEREAILASGARSLNELLEMQVPGLQWVYHSFGMSHLGMRGIVSNRDDKYLLLLDGQNLNHFSHAGAYTERDLPLLGDIDHVEVVHGAAAAVNGLGAVAMTINIMQRRASKAGCEGGLRAGAVERFASVELSCAGRLGALQWQWFGGVADYAGAANRDAPLVFGTALGTRWGDAVGADGRTDALPFSADRAQYRDRAPVKLALRWWDEGSDGHLRYTRGGEMSAPSVLQVALRPVGNASASSPQPYAAMEFGYQQLSAHQEFRRTLGEARWSASIEAVSTDYEERAPVFGTLFTNREDRVALRGLWRQRVQAHELSAGASQEWRYVGRRSPGYPDQVPSSEIYPGGMPAWGTRALSGFAEDQLKLSEHCTLIAGLRLEKHSTAGFSTSPRASYGCHVSAQGHLTLAASRAQRAGFEDELHAGGAGGHAFETQDSLELLYRWRSSQYGHVDLNAFINRLRVIGFVQTAENQVRSQPVGTQRSHGVEASWTGRWLGGEFSASHAWVGLDSFSLAPGVTDTQVTAAPNGYGRSLNGYANHLSKLTARGPLAPGVSWWANAVVYHGFSGTADRLRYLDSLRLRGGLAATSADPAAVADRNVYFNAGLLWKGEQDLEASLHAYNIAGWFDERLNKRNYLNHVSQVRLQAPSVSAQLRWRW